MKSLYTYSSLILLILLVSIDLSGQVSTEPIHKEDKPNFFPFEEIYPYNSSAKMLEEENYLLAYKRYSKLNDDWSIFDSIEYKFNSGNELVSEVYHPVVPLLEYYESYKLIYEYDFNGNLILMTNQKLSGDSWINDTRISNSYDENNNLLTEIREYFSSIFGWDNRSKKIYEYDTNGNLSFLLYQTWGGSDWYNIGRTTYEYDINNNLIVSLFEIVNGVNWLNNYRIKNEYDSNGNLISRTEKIWGENKWNNIVKVIYSYDQYNNVISEYEQKWDNDKWNNTNVSYYSYNDNNDITKQALCSRRGTAWVFEYRILYEYDHKQKKKLHQVKINNSWVDTSREIYFYSKEFPIIKPNSMPDIYLYPNPSTGQVTM